MEWLRLSWLCNGSMDGCCVLVLGSNCLFDGSEVMWIICTVFSLYLASDRLLLSFPSTLNDSHFCSYRVISKVVPAPEAKPSTPVSRPKTPPPVPSPVPAPIHVTPPSAPAPPAPQATVSQVLIPPPSPAVSAAAGSKAPVRSVVTETVSTYVVGNVLPRFVPVPVTFVSWIVELLGDSSSQNDGTWTCRVALY